MPAPPSATTWAWPGPPAGTPRPGEPTDPRPPRGSPHDQPADAPRRPLPGRQQHHRLGRGRPDLAPPAGPGGRQIAFSSFTHLARTAERGLFDFFFLAEGLRLREHQGRIHDLDVVGRPESLTVLAALAATTERLGLAATVNATFNEPYELARRLATLDHLSASRAAWNVVTSFDAFTGENFRRGGFLDRADRYTRAAEFVATARELWDAAAPDGAGQPVAHNGQHFRVEGRFGLPRSPQGHPVVIQAGDSPEGGSSPPPRPTSSSPATARWRRAAPSTPT
ncbi:LLM class flavin-dependent oxidoreductase [Actinomadura keratinilytica]